MSCSRCGGKSNTSIAPATVERVKATLPDIAGKSADPNKKVRVRYYGGGLSAKKVSRCATCGAAKSSYSRITNELIQFASDDAPNGMFSEQMEAGRDYWVTEKQAEYLLSLTYPNQAGQIVHKFKRID